MSRVESLAARAGVEPEYVDVWGRVHPIARDTLVALVRAMQVPVADDAALEGAIAQCEREAREAPLPRVRVLTEGEAGAVAVRLAGAGADDAFAWALECEDATTRRGEFRPSELARIAAADDASGADAFALPLPPALPAGYHRLEVLRRERVIGRCLVIVAPPACHRPAVLDGDGRAWGASVQLYAVRSLRNWGIGDFTDLGALVELWGSHGADVVCVNPLHATFWHNPEGASPYSPSSRRFLNPLYLDVESIEDFAECGAARELVAGDAFQARLGALRAADLVDYSGVAAAKREVLEVLYAHFSARHLSGGTPRGREFESFVEARGEALHRHALFEALQERFHRDDPAVWGWPAWPPAYRSPDADAVRRFAHEARERVNFFAYLQWQADVALAAVARRALDAGMKIGVCGDLAVSVDRAGSDAWSGQALFAAGASIGAPPDAFNFRGQDWGLPPLIPRRLAEASYAPFADALRACMRHCGALRVDHVMALMRLYWIAEGGDAGRGAYVRYPFDDLLAIVRLESVRHRCLVVGEDLGTVPPEIRAKLAAAGVLSYRLLYFERDAGGGFLAPSRFEPRALVAASTHDLPTLAGWWEGRDLDVRTRLDLFPTPQARERQIAERARDRAELLRALAREGLLPAGAGVGPASPPAMTPAFARAVHRLLARTPSKLVTVQLEDVLCVAEQVNLPGTTDAYPNWRRKLPLPLEQWSADERFVELARALELERAP